MAKIPAAKANISVGGVALESQADSIAYKLTQETIVVTGFTQSGPERVVGNYDASLSLGGNNDFAAGAVDATLWGGIGSSAMAMIFDPTGNSTAAANNPFYNENLVLNSYTISAQVGQAVKFSAEFDGHGAVTRSTST